VIWILNRGSFPRYVLENIGWEKHPKLFVPLYGIATSTLSTLAS